MMTMKTKLRAKRVIQGMTQEDISKLLGYTKGTFSKKENGHISFSVEDVKELRNILGLTDEEVIDIFFTD